MNIIELLTQREFLIAVLAAVSAAAVVFTFGSGLINRSEMKTRIKRVALERDKMRAEEMARLRGNAVGDGRSSIRRNAETKTYMKKVVERFDLKKAFQDDATVDKLAMGGFRGQGHLITHLFMRFATPLGVLVLVAFYFLIMAPSPDRPLYLGLLYAIGAGLAGSYLPKLLLHNAISKRQASIRKAWPDCLDLLLLCVEAGMSMEHAFKRVAKEIGQQSVELAEELTLTTAELSFLEDRGRAYENLGRRTGLDNVRSVMTALIQADRYGTSVGQALRVMAEEGREARMSEAEKKAASLPPKLTVPLILFFLPVLFIVIMSPAIIKVFSMPPNPGL